MRIHRRGYSVGGKGVYNAICQVCRGKFKNFELQRRPTDNLLVCREDFETRDILELYKPRTDTRTLPWTSPDQRPYGQVHAVLSADVGSPTLGTYTLLAFNTERADVLAEFTTGTSTFQPSADGTYNVTAAFKANLVARGASAVAIYKNGVLQRTSHVVTIPLAGEVYNQVAYEMDLLNTDQITVRYYVTGTGTTISSEETATFIDARLVS